MFDNLTRKFYCWPAFFSYFLFSFTALQLLSYFKFFIVCFQIYFQQMWISILLIFYLLCLFIYEIKTEAVLFGVLIFSLLLMLSSRGNFSVFPYPLFASCNCLWQLWQVLLLFNFKLPKLLNKSKVDMYCTPRLLGIVSASTIKIESYQFFFNFLSFTLNICFNTFSSGECRQWLLDCFLEEFQAFQHDTPLTKQTVSKMISLWYAPHLVYAIWKEKN